MRKLALGCRKTEGKNGTAVDTGLFETPAMQPSENLRMGGRGGQFTVLPFCSAPIMGRDDDNVCLREEEMANIRVGDCGVAETELCAKTATPRFGERRMRRIATAKGATETNLLRGGESANTGMGECCMRDLPQRGGAANPPPVLSEERGKNG